MPIIYEADIDSDTKLAAWLITEPESFFTEKVSVQREITHPQKRRQHLAGRYLLRTLFPDFPTGQIRIAPTRKPFLEDDLFHFSISHCADIAAVCISRRHRTGVDVEKITGKTVLLHPKFMNEREKAFLPGWKSASLSFLKGEYDPMEFCCTLTWSVKEALFKWYGAGNVDFREHMEITGILWQDDHIEVQAAFYLPSPVTLKMNAIVIDDAILAWIVT